MTIALLAALRAALGADGALDADAAHGTYDLDASMLPHGRADAVAVPRTAAEVQAVFRAAAAAGAPVVARGAGTGISGGAIPTRGGVVLSTARMDRVLSIDARSRLAVVEPGLVNLELSQRLAPLGLMYAPDPSSQRASTIGGNIGENAGGPHCLKYGVTTNHVLALDLVLADGTLVSTGDGVLDAAGYDLTALVVGSEGTLGCVTRALVRLTPVPEAVRVVMALFPDVVSSSAAVSAVIAAGHLPTSLEVMDRSAIRSVNSAYGLGLPETAGACLIVEVDGVLEGLDGALAEIAAICAAHGAFDLRPAHTAAEQARIWWARKSVAGAIGRLAPAYYLMDSVVPRTQLPLMMANVERLRGEFGLDVVNVFHAGDGNLHPLVLYDPRDPEQQRRALAFGEQVLRLSIAVGGVVSGEHGIGVEKNEFMPLLFTPADLAAQAALVAAFDPHGCCNPGKVFPSGTDPRGLAAERQARIVAAYQTRPLAIQELVQQLETVAGGAAVVVGPPGDANAVRAASPACVLRPDSLDQLAASVAACHRAGAGVRVAGGTSPQSNEGHEGHEEQVAVGIDIILLNRVLFYEPDDLTITVEAGITLAALQAVLAAHGQFLPLDVAQPERVTLGALVAAAADGPRRLGYGSLRDLLLGVTVVEADGTVIKAGGRVVKNVSGYDLTRLQIGARGTLGVIAALSLKVYPRPPADATLLARFGRLTDALAWVARVSASRLQPTALELLVEGGETRVLLRAEGTAAAVARHMAEGARLAEGALGVDRADAAVWEAALRIADTSAVAADAALLRLCGLPAQLDGLLLDCVTTAAAAGAELRLTARTLSGVVYARICGAATARAAVHHALAGRWPHCHRLAGTADAALPRWGAPRPAEALEQRVRAALDPCGTFH